MKHLSYETLPEIAPALCEKRSRPERILQFGEGNFLRGFVDYFVDVANEKTDYGSSVVVVTPRSGKKVDDFKRQDCLYTLCLNGIEQGKNVDEHRIICAISRCINGRDAFDDVLSYARSEDLRILISNTTEAGITTCDTDKYTAPGVSAFPAKLTRFLHERYTSLGQEAAPGLLILPCELIENNASQLKVCEALCRFVGFG